MRILTGSSKCVISIFAIFLTVLIASVTSYGQNGVTPGSQPETIRADSPNMTCSNLLNRSNTNWSLGQQISLTIRAIPKPPDVSTLAATYEENQVNLFCETPCDGGKDIIRHEYRQKTRSGTFGSWIPIPNSGAGGVNVAGYSITSLNNTEQFIVFQVSIKHGCVIRLLG